MRLGAKFSELHRFTAVAISAIGRFTKSGNIGRRFWLGARKYCSFHKKQCCGRMISLRLDITKAKASGKAFKI